MTTCEDGPLLLRGPFELLTQDGRTIDPGRATVALCRCGRSASKPFCDGSHKATGFRAPSEPDEPVDRPALAGDGPDPAGDATGPDGDAPSTPGGVPERAGGVPERAGDTPDRTGNASGGTAG